MFSPVTPVPVGPRPSRASTKSMSCGRLLSVLSLPLVCVGLLDLFVSVPVSLLWLRPSSRLKGGVMSSLL